MGDNWKEISAEWQGELGFIGKNSGGVEVQMGSVAGQPGASPMELVLMALAGCTGMDVASLMVKMRQNVTKFELTVRGNRADEHPKKYTEIEVIYELWGVDLDTKSVETAIALSENKYCAVSATLGAAAKIRTSYIIHPVLLPVP